MSSKSSQVANGNGSAMYQDVSEQVDKSNQDRAENGSEPVFSHFQLARVFARQFKKELCFNHSKQKWYWYNGSRWILSTGQHSLKLQEFIEFKFQHSKKTPTGADHRHVERLARDWMSKVETEFDANPYSFGTPEFYCVLDDCEDGRNLGFSEVKPKWKHYVTMNTAADVSDKESPKWLEFLKVAIPDEETREWLRLVFGQALIGKQTEHIFIYIYGPAGTGKTLFIERILNALGDYAGIFPRQYLVQQIGERHPTGIAELLNKRIVFADEVVGKTWDQNFIKQITGGGTISARRMCQDFFSFKPSHTLVAVGNDLPAIKFETAMEHRLRVIHFNSFPTGEVNQKLETELDEEAGGILRWLVEGAQDYLANHYGKNPKARNSLYIPVKVRNDTEAYLQADAYLFRELVGEGCIFKLGGEIKRKEATELANQAVPRINFTTKRLRELLGEFGGVSSKHTNAGDVFVGISKNPDFVQVSLNQ